MKRKIKDGGRMVGISEWERVVGKYQFAVQILYMEYVPLVEIKKKKKDEGHQWSRIYPIPCTVVGIGFKQQG